MVLVLRGADWRAIFPRASNAIIQAFIDGAPLLAAAGITLNRTRLAFALANVAHECDGFTLKNLTEDFYYSAENVAKAWPGRFADAAAVRKAYGTGYGWQKKAIEEIYAERMGNGRGTTDGLRFIGRGGPQIIGREEYWEVGQRCGLDLVSHPELASEPRLQPAILAAFWSWKALSAQADVGNFHGFLEKWKGHRVSLSDQVARLSGHDPVVSRLSNVAALLPILETIRFAPPTSAPVLAHRISG